MLSVAIAPPDNQRDPEAAGIGQDYWQQLIGSNSGCCWRTLLLDPETISHQSSREYSRQCGSEDNDQRLKVIYDTSECLILHLRAKTYPQMKKNVKGQFEP